MKKTYIEPSVEVVELDAESILAASLATSDEEVDTNVDPQLGREDVKHSDTNVWEQGW